MSRRSARAVLWVLFASVSAATAQDTLRVDVEFVNIVATVTDEDGRYVPDLRAEDFVIEDNGVPQQITHFSQDQDIPISLGIALDTSGSMAQRMRTALAALDRFIVSLHPNDEIFVATFSNRVSLVEGLTSDRKRLSDALMRVEVAGGTALYDALADSIDRVRNGRYDKRAVLILTDGTDTSSDLRLADTLDIIRRAEVLVYGLGIDTLRFADEGEHVTFDWPLTPIPGLPGLRPRPATDSPVDMRILESFASASGGKAHLVSGTWTEGTQEEIDQVLDAVAAELRSQYTLGFYPSSPSDGRFHPIRVRVRGRDYTVRTRNGYRSPDPR